MAPTVSASSAKNPRSLCKNHLFSLRAVDPHSFVADPDPAVFLNVDPDPAALKMRIKIQLNFFFFYTLFKIFRYLYKTKKERWKERNNGASANLL